MRTKRIYTKMLERPKKKKSTNYVCDSIQWFCGTNWYIKAKSFALQTRTITKLNVENEQQQKSNMDSNSRQLGK